MSKINHNRKDCVITIELGTNAVRVFAFDLTGNIIGSAKGAYPTFHPEPDYSEQDPEQLFITMLYVLKNFLNDTVYAQKFKVTTICFSAAMHSVLAIDKNGIPLGNVITWADNRGKNEAKSLKNSSPGKTIYKATGTPINYYDLPGLFEAAEAARKKIADRIILQTPDEYINPLGSALAIAADGIWEDPSYMHGAIAWRMRLPAWRGGGDARRDPGDDRAGRVHARPRARAGPARPRTTLRHAAQPGRRTHRLLGRRHGQARCARAERLV